MNLNLRAEIIRHVFANFGIIHSEYVSNKTRSLMSKEYLLPEKLSFDDDDGNVRENKVWGCQLSADAQEVKVLLADCTQEKDFPEYCLLIQLKNAPSYGLYLVFNESFGPQTGSACLLAYSLNSNLWAICNTFLQATFLGGMEQIKDTGLAWNKITNYQSQYQDLISFIRYHSSVYEAENEG